MPDSEAQRFPSKALYPSVGAQSGRPEGSGVGCEARGLQCAETHVRSCNKTRLRYDRCIAPSAGTGKHESQCQDRAEFLSGQAFLASLSWAFFPKRSLFKVIFRGDHQALLPSEWRCCATFGQNQWFSYSPGTRKTSRFTPLKREQGDIRNRWRVTRGPPALGFTLLLA